jgi:hypothetical protein
MSIPKLAMVKLQELYFHIYGLRCYTFVWICLNVRLTSLLTNHRTTRVMTSPIQIQTLLQVVPNESRALFGTDVTAWSQKCSISCISYLIQLIRYYGKSTQSYFSRLGLKSDKEEIIYTHTLTKTKMAAMRCPSRFISSTS